MQLYGRAAPHSAFEKDAWLKDGSGAFPYHDCNFEKSKAT
jgi:hypothetical protein